MSEFKVKDVNWDKIDGMVPVIVQDYKKASVLMLGYMNEEALNKTVNTGKVTFYSRTKGRLWVKGETSGNFLNVMSIGADCDKDCILIKANPVGPTCHLGTQSCFDNENMPNGVEFLSFLSSLIEDRYNKLPEGSYTTKLFNEGIDKIAQKVGEEAVETVIASKNSEVTPLLNESADLVYHLIVLLRKRDLDIYQVLEVLRSRHVK